MSYSNLRKCELCPRRCGVDRTRGERGFCRAGIRPAVYSFGAHHGEEPPLSGSSGSGTVFFTHCTMGCVYCQNFAFSQNSEQGEMSEDELAGIMLGLQKQGCHNINLVSPTQYAPQIAQAVRQGRAKGLTIPIVYNTGGYDMPETVALLEGIVDIYMPDMRYSDDAMALRYSNVSGYVDHNRRSVRAMHRQAGDLVLDGHGIAKKGL
ncbi:MAG: radical SAM protein, partial [Candidatus Omnitrophica bacterium]|nr:radical SAM protein [Candidatus Omnitrophota bacterium]